MSNDLFDQTGSVGLQTPQLDPSKDYLAELVGDGKKFKDASDLAKGKAYSDAHIATLEQTLTGLRQELQQRKTTEDLINHINTLANKSQMPAPEARDNPAPGGEIKPGLSLEDVQRLLADRDEQSKRSFNLNSATRELREKFGDNASTVIDAKAKELGVSKDYLRGIAEQVPSMFMALMANTTVPVAPATFHPPSPSSYRTPPQDKQPLGETWSKMNEVKKTNPDMYWSAGYQRKLMAAAEKAMAEDRYDEFMAS